VTFELNVGSVNQTPLPNCDSGNFGAHTFGCDNAIGDIHVGHFTVDDIILSSDGLKTGVPISNFFLKIGDVVWDQENPSDFDGFRDTVTPLPLAIAPGLVVSGGALVDLAGGVFGFVDNPFVDFSNEFGVGPNQFAAVDLPTTVLVGSLTISDVSRVPEPATLALFFFGVMAVCRSRIRLNRMPGLLARREG
jgi:PEP-CTERM motif